MMLQNMFQKDINRSINGVIKVMQTDDENRRQELEEYVITRELQKHFGTFYDHYEQSLEGPTDKIGVWISGFFGSGKSHFLKILSYLLANEEICGRRAIDYFEEKFEYDPYRYAMMRRVSETPTEVILFNIDAKSPMGKDQNAILRVFTKVFYEHCGYYGDDMKVATLERFLDRQGKLAAFKEAFLRANSEPWQTAREAFAFWEDDVVTALMAVTGISEQSAHNWFNGTETAEISIDRLTREIAEYVAEKAPNFHLVFMVDEIGQYIGDDSGLMLNLQTLVEELGSKCRGQVWVIVTSQEDIDSVTHVKGNDFSKIQGRFNTRLSLSSASVDEVIKRRILAKNESAEALLRLVYQQNVSVMRNLFTFAQGTVADLKGYSAEDEFVEGYPFVPYQFKLLQDVLVQIRKHGSSGKHLSGGERSMLSAFQEAAQSVREREEGSFVPFHAFYDTVHTFLDGTIRRVIDRADRAAQAGDGLQAQDVDVLKLLFLIRYVDGIPSNIENLSTLMVSDIQADKITIRRALQESLDRLVRENYAARNGEIYLFLTDEEQDVNREIRNLIIDENDVIHMIGQAVFADLYPGKKYRYKNHYDFSFDPMVDDAVIGQPSGDIRLRLITLAYGLREGDANAQLILQSRAGNEAIVLLNTSCGYFHEFEEVRRIEKYIKQRNISQLPESIRKIIQGKQAEAREREKSATALLKEAIIRGEFYIAGERVALRAASLKETLDAALARLVEIVYSKLAYINVFAQSDGDIQRILIDDVQECLPGMAQPNAQALDELQQYMEIRTRQHMNVTMAEIQKRFQAAPYGWREIDIAALIATLMRGQKLQLIYNGAALLPSDRRAADCLRKRSETEKTLVRQKISAPDVLVKKARSLASELFGAMDLRTDEENLCGQLETLLTEANRRNAELLARYSPTIAYPGRDVAERGKRVLDEILARRGDNIAFLEAFTKAEDALLDWFEDVREVEFFFQNQRKIFDSAWEKCATVQRERHYFADEAEALAAADAMSAILKSPNDGALCRGRHAGKGASGDSGEGQSRCAPRGNLVNCALGSVEQWRPGRVLLHKGLYMQKNVLIDIRKSSIADHMEELSQEIDLFPFPEGEGSGANPPKLKYATKAATEAADKKAADKKAEAPASWVYLPRKQKHIPVLVQAVGEKKSYAYYTYAAVNAGDRVVIGYPYAEDKALPGNTFQHVGIVQESTDKPEIKRQYAVNLAYAFGQTVTKRDVTALADLMKHGYAERRNGWFGGADYHFGLKLDFILQGITAQILAAVSVLVRSDLATAESVSQAKKLLQEMPVHKGYEAVYDNIREFNKTYSNEYGFDGVAGAVLDEPELIRERMELVKCRAMAVYDPPVQEYNEHDDWLKKNVYASQIKKRGYADTAQELFYTLPVAPKADRLLSDYLNRCVLMEAVGVMMNCGLRTMLKTYLLACPPLFGCVKALTEYARQKGVTWAVTLLEAYRRGDMEAIRNDAAQDEAPIQVKFTAPEKTGPVKRIGLKEKCDAEKACWMQFETEMQWAERAECGDAQRIAWRADADRARNDLEKALVKTLPKKLDGKRFALLGFDGDLAKNLTQRIQAAGGDVLAEADGADYAVIYAKSANGGAEAEMTALHQAAHQAQLVSDRALWRALPKRMAKA